MMFERFTKQARGAVVAAQDSARASGASRIDTRHVLLALLERGGLTDALGRIDVDAAALTEEIGTQVSRAGLDGAALGSLGIDLDEVARRTDEVFGPGSLGTARRGRGSLPFARDAKKALELGLREAVALGDRSIDARHLALGILRADCPGREALTAAGVDPDRLRSALQERPARSA
ncbi:hypothetical protein GCE65_04035 [Pseudactinotalea sp. HY158]|nr:hypothetical protein GCE65_04035 [Pseudactinotalea sp. HY158]